MSSKQLIYQTDNKIFTTGKSIFTFYSGIPMDMKLWLRADAGITKDANNKVSIWQDQSGNGYNAIQNIAENQPLWVDGVLNEKPVLQFDGAQFMTNSFSQVFSQPNTVFVVYNMPNAESTNRFVLDGINSTQRNAVYFLENNQMDMFAGGTVSNLLANEIPPFSHLLTTGVFNGENSQHYINGDLRTTGNPGANAVSGFTIGERFDFINPLRGDIAEIIFYNRLLATTERKATENYLIAKYGL